MPERKTEEGTSIAPTPHPKKTWSFCSASMRLRHEELIRPQQPPNESPEAQKLGRLPSSPPAQEEELEVNQGSSTSLSDEPKGADLVSLANSARLAKTDTLGLQNDSLANPARLANGARLPAQRTLTSLMDSLPEIAGFTKLHHQVVDHLYCQLSPKEQVVHIQLYRLSWGMSALTVLISLPKLAGALI